MPVEERGPEFKANARSGEGREIGSTCNSASVQKLQTALQAKAKGSPGYRFYLLYDKVYRKDVLIRLPVLQGQSGRSGGGQPRLRGHRGVRGERWLGELATELHRRRRIGRKQCGECGYRSGRHGSARSVFPRSPTGRCMTAAVLVLSAHLRSRHAGRATRLPSQPALTRRCAGAQPDQHRSHASHRRGFGRLL